jgi:DNA repair protein RecO (recombination protein O)
MFRFLVDSIEKLDLLNEEELSLAVIYFLLKLSDKLGIEPQAEISQKRYFLPAEGVFSDIERMDTITRTGPGVDLIQNLLMEEQMTYVSAEAKREALDLLLMYFQLHLPSFKVDRTLEVIREILYH